MKLPPSSRVWTSAFARQSASFALATTHSKDVLFNASRPTAVQIFPLAHEVRCTKQIILRNCGVSFCPSYFDSEDSLRGRDCENKCGF